MTTFMASRRFRPPLSFHRLINPKPISSSLSRFPNPPDNQSRNISDSTCEVTSELQYPHTTSATVHSPSIPILNTDNQGDDDVNDARVIQVLLGRRNDPVSALQYCNWVKPLPRLYEEGGDVFWVLVHILFTSPHTHDRASNLLVMFVSSSNPTVTPSVMVNNLVDSSKRFGFEELSSRAFNYLLNAYVRIRRMDYAVDCFDLMVERNVVPFVPYVNNVLRSLVRSNLIGEAKEVYNKMVLIGVGGDNVTTQLLMRASLRERNPEEAVRIFRRVMSRGAEVDGLLYSFAVQAACKMPDLVLAMDLLREMREKLGVPASQETYTSVIVACVKEGKMEEAVRVTDEMVGFGIPMSVISATSLITGYCKGNELGKALDFFNRVEEEGLAPDKVMFSVMIEWFCKTMDMGNAVEIYKRMKAVGIAPSSVLVHTMIQGFLKAESPEAALEIFSDSFETWIAHGFMCNKIFLLLCKQGKVDAATIFLRMMEDKGIEPNVVFYNNLMLAHCRMKNMDLASSIFSEMLQKGLKPNNFTYSILIDGFFKNQDVQSARDVINKVVSSNFEANEVVYNTFINGLCKVGQTSKAKEMLQNLIKEERCSRSCTSYNSIIDGFVKEGETDSAVETYREMSGNGISPNVVTFTSLISGFCKSDRMDLALEMIHEMKSKDLKLDVPAYGALIDGFCKKHDMKTAYTLFSELMGLGLIPNVSVYNSLISGFRDLGKMDAAIDLYKKMVNDGISCDLFTYTTLIDGLLKGGNLIAASDLYSELVALGIVPDEILHMVLVNGLSKKGQFVRASKLLEEMKKKDVTPNVLIYSTVIAGHHREGNLNEAFRLHEEMLEKGLVHDDTVLNLLVSGKVEKPLASCSQDSDTISHYSGASYTGILLTYNC
ncbi:PREDICTED: pentatricopeptide repeat-containing protein At2g39230, mitochondrial-like [Camelina sativa]|uniref:Pentatricopeptide repeat-containing protein At2g39230, mitochondrial-like n=1 Tax=Camelina sativa TaxID=90675 RepID=A0ABM1RU48_CAMSA|nr:PREDICTED: pentatricopeptide repeat-containing protein At2g39230, mitochondrial-like [Camelina sativa]XP_019102536.1 PREDICTED: pentatricopeptide repeat-containing protein At2g39230, mitochondrial-like [Camelina sativa]